MINRDQIYHDYRAKVSGYVFSRISHRQDAEDVISTVFMKVYANLDSYDERRAKLSTWIYAITRNAVVDYYKSRKIAHVTFDDALMYENAADESDYDELLEKLTELIVKLPQLQRDVIVLRYFFNLGHKEISARIGMSYANTRKLCSLAVAALREMMTEK